ncbi:sulfhydryl oxidase 2-like isoform X2 [Tetranychus urticae]|uniref:sulfhydryl oxidase 2-like isoform X2 n=1 Tax=Tetranychus urticae TaxID=32264 RepID=UPI00077B850D|nr:sulfhydryl oxidase 2-like isoform X2 [Tetranychus urticae]
MNGFLLFLATIIGILYPVDLTSKWYPRPPSRQGRPVLYKLDDPNIINLDSENFETFVTNPNRDYILLVQFYIDWSEGSRSVVQAYSDLARNISTWENIVRVGAINCAEENNIDVCREYGWVAYPVFKLFPPGNIMATPEPSIKLIEYNTVGKKMYKFRNVILEYIDQLITNHTNYPTSWPVFDSLQVDSLKDLETHFQNQTKDSTILLLIDRDNRDLNRMVLLDMSVYQANLIIRRTQLSQQLYEQLKKNSSGEPIFLFMSIGKHGKSFLKLISSDEIGGNNRESITKYIETHFATNIRNKRMDPIYMSDLYKGLRHSLYNEVTLHKKLNGSQIAALAAYISVIYRYFPFDNENPRRFFKRMDQWMRIRKPDKILDSIDLLAIMRVGSEGFIPQTDHYHHCKSGYPCSLWLIFHALTVSEYIKNNRNKMETIGIDKSNSINSFKSKAQAIETSSSSSVLLETTISLDQDEKERLAHRKKYPVLFAMRDYVRHFYSCAECSSHFTTLSNDFEQRLIFPNSSLYA